LYIGVTNDLARRVFEHREGTGARFAKRYGVKLLVYFESYPDIRDAIAREKMLKKWRRDWKLQLIEANNPQWCDLYESLRLRRQGSSSYKPFPVTPAFAGGDKIKDGGGRNQVSISIENRGMP